MRVIQSIDASVKLLASWGLPQKTADFSQIDYVVFSDTLIPLSHLDRLDIIAVCSSETSPSPTVDLRLLRLRLDDMTPPYNA